jgi:BirA family biotin operon repressor/biotin-[acetyl-CoA-carboxylase] ligase
MQESCPPANDHLVALLRALDHRRAVDRDSLARTTGLDDTAITAALEAAGRAGIGLVHESSNKMRLAAPFEALDVEAVARALPAASRRAFDLHVVDHTGSTNADLMAAAGDLPSGHVLAAESQGAGRGRRGRRWTTVPGGALAFSVLWKFRRSAAELAGLSLAVGIAVARAVDAAGGHGAQLKWPNDLIVRQDGGWAKLAGILIELAPAADGRTGAVIGIGINMRMGATAAGNVDQPVTDIARLGVTPARNVMLALLLDQLHAVLVAFEIDGFAPHVAEWNRRHAFAGIAVGFPSAGDAAPVQGVAVGVDAVGALLVDTPAGMRQVISGEVSVRPLDD